MADDLTTSPDSDALGTGTSGSEITGTEAVGQTSPDEAPSREPDAAEPDVSEQDTTGSAPEPAAAVATPPEPSVATTLLVAPLEPSPAPLATAASPGASAFGDAEGGEWELLLQKVSQWLNQGELQSLWAQAQRPVTALATLVALLLVLRVYSAVLGALDGLPLVPGLLELAGVVWLVRYGVPKLLRSSERERLLGGLNQGWKAFRGKG